MVTIEKLYQQAGELHGSTCPGVILGVRMSLLGCRLIGIDEPKNSENRKKLLILVETDRCATDGIQSVTGCSIGRRTLKVVDYGILAATFYNFETKRAVRISVRTDARAKAKDQHPHEVDKNLAYITAYKTLPTEEIFIAEEVTVDLSSFELPGPPPPRSQCNVCGEEILSGREIHRGQTIVCRRCARLPLYYKPTKSIPVSGSGNQAEFDR
ncbi:MAG: formylmethanofuran dehydrogenase [Deltaproteobacteria bacterium]|nr:formylmethanofuran dehydrogenase [Deltaproteobacteria bacterium]